MKHFKQLDFPVFENIYDELTALILSGKVNWANDQICINAIERKESSYSYGVGSLNYDWDNIKIIYNNNGTTEMKPPVRQDKILESDFKVICEQFKNTSIEELYAFISKKYKLGRVRFMKSEPKTCLSWHKDLEPRLHYPIVTNDGCIMVIDNEVLHLPAHTWWMTNTLEPHTAFNASRQSRIHIVASVLEGY